MKILKIDNCAVCPHKLWASPTEKVCTLSGYKIINIPVTEIPDWCPLEDDASSLPSSKP